MKDTGLRPSARTSRGEKRLPGEYRKRGYNEEVISLLEYLPTLSTRVRLLGQANSAGRGIVLGSRWDCNGRGALAVWRSVLGSNRKPALGRMLRAGASSRTIRVGILECLGHHTAWASSRISASGAGNL